MFLNTNKHGFFDKKTLVGYSTSKLLDNLVEPARAQVLITRPIPGLKLKERFIWTKGITIREIDQRILLAAGETWTLIRAHQEERTTKSIQRP